MVENQSYLFSIDFDKTIANTFETSPNGIGVLKAYDMSILNIFGSEGYDIYQNKLNGLQNRAPSELVDLLVSFGDEKKLLKQAGDFFNDNAVRLLSLLPEEDKKNNGFNWDKKSEKLVDLLTWMLAAEKCSFLSDEIGKKLVDGQTWPKPCNGFIDFYESINEINKRGGIKIDTAIISSGHTKFIEKTFETFGLDLPNYVITDDELRRVRNIPINRKTKPGAYPFAVIHRSWLRDNYPNYLTENEYHKDKIIYFGDDQNKDGSMAKNCRVTFGWFNEGSVDPFSRIDNGFSFNDWRVVGDIVNSQIETLVRGGSMSQVFLENE